MLLTLVAAGGVFAYAVFRSGAGLAEDWYPCAMALGVIGLVYWLRTKREKLAPSPPTSLLLLIVALTAVACWQIVPLPASWVGVFSPERLELHQALTPVLGYKGFTTLSVAPAETFRYLLILLEYVVAFFLARELVWRTKSKTAWFVVAPFVAVAFLEGVLGLLQVYGAGNDWAQGTYINRNHYAGLLEMALPFAVMGAVAVWRRETAGPERSLSLALSSCGLLAMAAIVLLGIVHSLSRMGFIAALAGLFTAGALVFAGGSMSPRARTLALAAAALGIVVAFIYLPTDSLIVRFAGLETSEEVSAGTRVQIWRDTGRLVEMYPLWGCGLGGYKTGLMRYKTAAPLNVVDFAHNDYLQLLSELGLIGFTPLALLALRTARQALQLGRGPGYTEHVEERYLSIAAAASLAAISLHSMVDFNLYIPANALFVVWVAGLLDGLTLLRSRNGLRVHERQQEEEAAPAILPLRQPVRPSWG